MNRVQPIYEITTKMNELLDGEITSSNREVVIESILSLLDERELLINQEVDTTTYSEEEHSLGKSLLILNQEVHRKMNELFLDLKFEMKQVKKQKHSNRQYTNPYANVQTLDGMFMDKRK
ncbi:flagellar protein FliT [Ornithinibacillus halotolerans]|uniref:Flagellar protein FliT n=1 Tax=Ornithinibacillus halotolerans TaxID=1274357 RepID=A0A916W5G0_9BACI|nr:flagellar protein FliT [Ornithinibacillus halotolerans]GGA67230.1 hypothetical protein GCM10008025_08850 [Ornithinibacillus halotolerans]